MPVQFVCPQCRQLLKISRRKIGTICECPRCGTPTAVPAPTTTMRELAHASSNRLEGVPSAPISLFDDVNELLDQRPATAGNETSSSTQRTSRLAPADARWSQPADIATTSPAGNFPHALRTRTFMQIGLFGVVAAAAFAAGYLFGQGRTTTPPAPVAATTAPAAQQADWPTPTR